MTRKQRFEQIVRDTLETAKEIKRTGNPIGYDIDAIVRESEDALNVIPDLKETNLTDDYLEMCDKYLDFLKKGIPFSGVVNIS